MTCTTRTATTGMCGKPAVYTERSRVTGEVFAECAECAAAHGSMASTAHMVAGAARPGAYAVGDTVYVHRYGCVYTAKVTRVGACGAAYATFTYGNGAVRTVRVDETCTTAVPRS